MVNIPSCKKNIHSRPPSQGESEKFKDIVDGSTLVISQYTLTLLPKRAEVNFNTREMSVMEVKKIHSIPLISGQDHISLPEHSKGTSGVAHNLITYIWAAHQPPCSWAKLRYITQEIIISFLPAQNI